MEIKVGQVWSHYAQKGKAARVQSLEGNHVVLKDCADASEFSIDQFRLRSYWKLSIPKEDLEVHPPLTSFRGAYPEMEWCIGFYKKPGLIVDPYMGSGTTLIAATNLGLPSIGMDIDEKNCEIAAKRVQAAEH